MDPQNLRNDLSDHVCADILNKNGYTSQELSLLNKLNHNYHNLNQIQTHQTQLSNYQTQSTVRALPVDCNKGGIATWILLSLVNDVLKSNPKFTNCFSKLISPEK